MRPGSAYIPESNSSCLPLGTRISLPIKYSQSCKNANDPSNDALADSLATFSPNRITSDPEVGYRDPCRDSICTCTISAPSGRGYSFTPNPGEGKYGDKKAMCLNMLSFPSFIPSIGIDVCSGSLGTNVPVGSNSRVCARNAGAPVAVGPGHSSGDVWKYCGTFSGRQGQSSPLLREPWKANGSVKYRFDATSRTTHPARTSVVVRYRSLCIVIVIGGVGTASSSLAAASLGESVAPWSSYFCCCSSWWTA